MTILDSIAMATSCRQLHFVKPLQNEGEHICHGQKS